MRVGQWGAVRSVSCIYNKGINNNGSHMIDLLRLLLGPLRVVSVGHPINDFFADDLTIPALLSTADNIPVTLNIGNAGDYSIFELELSTEKALIRMEQGGLAWRIRQPEASPNFSGYRSLLVDSRQSGTVGVAMLAAVGEIDRLLCQGGSESSTGVNALLTQEICEVLSDPKLSVSISEGAH